MKYPRGDEYQVAIENADKVFADPILRVCKVARWPDGRPRVDTGNFASTYRLTDPLGRSWAVRCFSREVPERERRYRAIGSFLRSTKSKALIPIEYSPNCILVNGYRYPVTKMEWVSGHTLCKYIEQNIKKTTLIANLSKQFLGVISELETLGCAHGDLQHGNIMVNDKGQLVLVDYDGMFVPELQALGAAEKGHVNYQHPMREKEFHPSLDRFSSIVIYLALMAITPQRWRRYSLGGENMLFQQSDFRVPHQSELLRELRQDSQLHCFVEPFMKICSGRLEDVPRLTDFLNGHRDSPRRPTHLPTAQAQTSPTHLPTAQAQTASKVPAWEGERLGKCLSQRISVYGPITTVIDPHKYHIDSGILFFRGGFAAVTSINQWDDFLASYGSLAPFRGTWVIVKGIVKPPVPASSFLHQKGVEGCFIETDMTNGLDILGTTEKEALERLSIIPVKPYNDYRQPIRSEPTIENYSVSDAYFRGNWIVHPTFGKGKVVTCYGSQKIEVDFGGKRRFLPCNQSTSASHQRSSFSQKTMPSSHLSYLDQLEKLITEMYQHGPPSLRSALTVEQPSRAENSSRVPGSNNLVKCPECTSLVRADRLKKHLRKVHSIG